MTEIELDRAVRRLCGMHQVWRFHNRQARYGEPGWPDLVLIGARAAMLRELKGDRGVLGAEQARVGSMMRAAGWDWAVWWPADLASGRIERELSALGKLNQRAGR